ncbi:MAG: hypothetical protein SH859_06680 [Hyphomicrobium aestuarii]|nr:hypothetical protein [Hyphomicrobium aestuarii]
MTSSPLAVCAVAALAGVALALMALEAGAQSGPLLPATPAQPARTLGTAPDVDVPPWRQPSATGSAAGNASADVRNAPVTGGKPAVTGPAQRGRAYNVKPLINLQAKPRL